MRGIGGGQRRDHFRVTAWGRFGRIIAVENKLNRCSQSTAESQARRQVGKLLVMQLAGDEEGKNAAPFSLYL